MRIFIWVTAVLFFLWNQPAAATTLDAGKKNRTGIIMASKSADGDSLEAHVETKEVADFSQFAKRLAGKSAGSIIVGWIGGFGGILLGAYSLGIYGVEIGWVSGYSVGTAVGVSSVDPDDQFGACLTGSLIGMWIEKSRLDKDWFPGTEKPWRINFLSSLGAVIGSELSRGPTEGRRLSLTLSPTPAGSLSAVATLRF